MTTPQSFFLKKTCIAVAIAQTFAAPLEAATISVTNAGDSEIGCTLREAITSINQGFFDLNSGCTKLGDWGENDKIHFDDLGGGTAGNSVTLTSCLPSLLRSMTIKGGALNVGLTTINGDGNEGIFSIIGGSNTTMILDSLMITGGMSYQGGAILAGGSANITLVNSTISGNSGSSGGAIYADFSTGSLSLINSHLSDNDADNGGGIYIVGGSSNVSLNNSSISNNTATYDGGGVFVQGSGGNGLSLINSTISGNSAGMKGGGIYAVSLASNVSLSNSTLSDNSASKGGGIYTTQLSSISLTNSTVSGNSADIAGGIYNKSYFSVSLTNSIIANSINGDCFSVVTGSYSSAGTVAADDHNIIEDGSCSTAALSIDPKLGPLADNGGATNTHLLLNGSPAINMGDNSVCTAAPINNLDQLGTVRPFDGVCDIGSVEYTGSGDPVTPDEEDGFFVIPVNNGKAVIFGL